MTGTGKDQRRPLVDAPHDALVREAAAVVNGPLNEAVMKVAHRLLTPGRAWTVEVRWRELEVPVTPEPEQQAGWQEARAELAEAEAALQAAAEEFEDANGRARGAKAVSRAEERLAEAWRTHAQARRAEGFAAADLWAARLAETRPLPEGYGVEIERLERAFVEVVAALGADYRLRAAATPHGRRHSGEEARGTAEKRAATQRAELAAQELSQGPPPDLFEAGRLARAGRL